MISVAAHSPGCVRSSDEKKDRNLCLHVKTDMCFNLPLNQWNYVHPRLMTSHHLALPCMHTGCTCPPAPHHHIPISQNGGSKGGRDSKEDD